jgi:hypothetical protein
MPDRILATHRLRRQPGPRLAGEGAYAVARHGPHVHLAYALRERGRPAEMREDLRIAKEASYIVAVFAASVERTGRGEDEERRFLPLEPGDLDVPGTEIVLIGAGEAVVADAGAALDPSAEGATTDELRALVRDASGRPATAPLLDGIWH